MFRLSSSTPHPFLVPEITLASGAGLFPMAVAVRANDLPLAAAFRTDGLAGPGAIAASALARATTQAALDGRAQRYLERAEASADQAYRLLVRHELGAVDLQLRLAFAQLPEARSDRPELSAVDADGRPQCRRFDVKPGADA